MKLAILTRDDPWQFNNGLSRYHRELGDRLTRAGMNIEWIIGNTNKKTLDLGANLPDCDLVYVTSLPFGAKVKAPMVAKCNSPLREESKYYSLTDRVKAIFALRFEVATIQKAIAVISVSKFTESLLEFSPYFCIKSTVIPDGVDSQNFKPEKTIPFSVAWAGRKLDKRKGWDIAQKILVDGIPSFISDGNNPENLFRNKMNWAHAYLSTSRSEGFDQTLLQAMASGCACLVSDIPAHRELITHGENGWVYSNEGEARECLGFWSRNPEEVSRLGVAAREKALKYTWEWTAKLTRDVLLSALESHLPRKSPASIPVQ